MKIDVRGEICPYPMMKTSEALKKTRGRRNSGSTD